MNEFENLRRLLIEDRSIRRFDQSRRVARETLDSPSSAERGAEAWRRPLERKTPLS